MAIATTDTTTNMSQDGDSDSVPRSLPFPSLTTSHILACSYHSWHPHFRLHSPKARLVALSQPFLDYLRADGIVLPPDDNDLLNDDGSRFSETDDNNDSASISNSQSDIGSNDDDDDSSQDPSEAWPEIHSAIRSTISSLGGAVLPKLNWSAPKDATFMSATNDMTCRTANDVYLLLKSSDFITHDLEHAFDDCADVDVDVDTTLKHESYYYCSTIPYHLVLRKKFEINPALEFRCFVRNRHLLAISQRDMNYFDFLFELAPRFKSLISEFLHDVVLPRFAERNFVLDVYISFPPTRIQNRSSNSNNSNSNSNSSSRGRQGERVWLIDINPWAQRTDPLLFSWLELLTMPGPDTGIDADTGVEEEEEEEEEDVESDSDSEEGKQGGGQEAEVIRLPLRPASDANANSNANADPPTADSRLLPLIFDPELRLVRRDDPEAYSFASTKYSAHKLPKDVVDASMTPSAMIAMMEEWQRVMHRRPDEAEDSD